MKVYGIDVASYQGEEYPLSGYDFVIVKATEGITFTNPLYAKQVKRARDAGKIVGHYHFVNHNQSMVKQAKYFVTTAIVRTGEFLVLDWEDPKVTDAEKNTFIKTCKSLTPFGSLKVGLYCNKDYWLHRDVSSYCGDFLWIAAPSDPEGKPGIQHDWLFHQYSEAGGIDHNVANVANKAELAAFFGVKPKPTPPKYQPFPGASWFKRGRKSIIVAAMHARLLQEGCNKYKTHTNVDVIGSGDEDSYEAWQRKCGFSGKAATWPPGKITWDKLKVPYQGKA